MPIARVSEVTASSRHSFQDAIEQGFARAIASYRTKAVVVQEQKVLIETPAQFSNRPAKLNQRGRLELNEGKLVPADLSTHTWNLGNARTRLNSTTIESVPT